MRNTARLAPPRPRMSDTARRLAWQHVAVEGLDHNATTALLAGVEAGTITLDPAGIAARIEALIAGLHLHPACVALVRENGSAAFDYRGKWPRLGDHLCEACAKPLGCAAGEKHAYKALSPADCRALGIYHGGRCYHVSLCTGCGHVHSVDSSD